MTFTRRSAIFIGLIGFLAVAAIDLALGPDLSVLLFHLGPLMFVTWYAGRDWGVVLATMMLLLSLWVGMTYAPGAKGMNLHLLDVFSDFVAALLVVAMQSKLRASYDRVWRDAHHDALTGCLNRSGLHAVLTRELARCRRSGREFSLVYFDCDNFKEVNDAKGHEAGDAVLATVAQVLHASLRSVDASARVGGDEFALLLPETGADAVVATVEHVKKSLDGAMLARQFPITFSMGVATFARMPASVAQALDLADRLMYEVKKAGKNNVRYRTV